MVWQGVDLSQSRVELHVYTLNEDEAGTEEMDDEQVSMATQWVLPSAHFHGQWESLVFDEAIKERVSGSAVVTHCFPVKTENINVSFS